MNQPIRFTVLGAVVALTGCAATPNYDRHFGDAVRQARTAMTLNPAASGNPDPVTGIGGPEAAATQTRYQDSFKAPPAPQPVIRLSANPGSNGGGESR